MTDIVRYGVLGTAQIALNRHLPAAQAIGNAEIAAISSRDQAKAEASAAQYGIAKAYGSYQAVLDDPEIDAIINPLPIACTASGQSRRRRPASTSSAKNRLP